MSPRNASEAESGSAATARKKTRDDDRKARRLAVAPPAIGAQTGTPLPVESIGALTSAELAELSPPEARGVASGAFNKRFGESQLDWSALRTPTPLPPPPAAEPVILPSAVQAFYGKLPEASERAELRIADLSLDLANPFVGSSLMPPPPKKRPWLRPALLTLGGCLLIGSGYAGAVYHVERPASALIAKWMGGGVEPQVPLTAQVQPQLQAATSPLSIEVAHAADRIEDPAPLHRDAQARTSPAPVEAVSPLVSVQSTAVAQPIANVTPVIPETAVDATRTSRARRHALRAIAPAVAPAVAAKVLEPKPVTPSVTVPVTAAAPRTLVAPSPRPASAVPQNLPKDLSRAQVQTGLESVRDELQSCATGTHGRTVATVTISGSGHVSYATIEGAFAGTPQGSCMARALRGAQFPQSASPQLRVRYPFAL